MPIDWPLTLPQAPSSFNEQRGDTVVRSANDSGPDKTRRRFTKSKRKATMSFLLTIDQYKILDDFFETTLKGGSISMNFLHPWRQQVMEMYISGAPTFGNQDVLGVQTQVQVEYF